MGAWDGYYSLGGVEVANEERFRSYLANVAPWLPMPRRELDAYEGLHRALGDPVYTDPVTDRAPWVDFDNPVSADFLGFTVMTIEGLEDSVRTASATELLGRGGTIGLSRESSRSIRVTGLLVGLTPESVQQGFTWLEKVLWRNRQARPLVPQLPGVSDFRFFAQRPDVPDAIVNRVLNPDATKLGESLVGSHGTAYAFRSLDASGNWAYKMTARTAADAEVQLVEAQRALTSPGSTWVARVDVTRAASVAGQRYVNVMLRFRDQYGNVIYSVGKDSTAVPTGVLYRWTGLRFDSPSQMLTSNGMTTNWVLNPSAEGVSSSGLAPYTWSRSAVRPVASTALSGSRAYQITAGDTGAQSVMSQRAPAAPGQQWWGRAVGKQVAAVGSRHFRADLEWLDDKNSRVDLSTGTKVDLPTTGSVWSWTGGRLKSPSMEITGDAVRYNRNPNPTVYKDAEGYFGTGLATVAREAWRGLGTPIALRVTLPPAGRNWPDVGVNIPMQGAKVGETIYVTFWTLGVTALRLQGIGWTDVGGTVDPAVGINCPPTSATTPTRVTVPIKITAPTQILRICRKDDSILGTFRLARIGLMTGSDAYFDGDTGSYEWEGIRYKSSSIAHLPGDFDLYNSPWNGGFEQDTFSWQGDTGTSASYAPTPKRLQVNVQTARASGNGLLKMDMWKGMYGGQRVTAGMKVWNTSSAAISVSLRITTSPGSGSFDGATAAIPAGDSAWLAVPTSMMPGGIDSASVTLVARSAVAAGTGVLQVSKVFLGTPLDGATATEAMWFDGDSPSLAGQKFSPAAFDFAVGGVAPAGATGVRLLLTRLDQGAVAATDVFLADRVMLAQFDAVDSDPSDGTAPVPTMPDYFDGDFISTYQTIPTFVVNSTDASTTSAMVTANAPEGAVSAEIAIERDGLQGTPAVGDVFYLDNVMLADFDPQGGVPAYTGYTRHDLIAETERWMQDVGAVAGPTVIQDVDLDCRGAITQVEFTLVAENGTWLHDAGDTVPLPLPTQVSGTTGAGAFAAIEDTGGIIRNFMPQFAPNSGVIPSSWVTTGAGVNPYGANRGYDVNGVPQAYFLAVQSPTAGRSFKTVITAPGVLGSQGGYTNAVASIWLGGVRSPFNVLVEALRGATVVASAAANFTPPDTSYDFIGDTAHRLNIPLPAPANGLADGFRFTITANNMPVSISLIGWPQVVLTSAPQPLILGALPDEPGFTYGYDSAGFSYRKPVLRNRSETVFQNVFAPPVASAPLSGFDEVGMSTFRTYAEIPADVVPANAVAVPVLRADFDAFLTRWVRVRFYPNPMNVSPELIDTSTYEYEWVIDQFNGNVQNVGTTGYTSLVIDGVAQRVWLRALDGTVIPGDQYVNTSTGAPIDWPEFRGTPWVVSVEYPRFHQAPQEPANESWWRTSLALMIEE